MGSRCSSTGPVLRSQPLAGHSSTPKWPRTRPLLAGGIAVGVAACADPVAPPDAFAERISVEVLQANEESREQLESLIREVEPHITFKADGSWAIDPDVKLTTRATAFVREAQEAWASVEGPAVQTDGPQSVVASNGGG